MKTEQGESILVGVKKLEKKYQRALRRANTAEADVLKLRKVVDNSIDREEYLALRARFDKAMESRPVEDASTWYNTSEKPLIGDRVEIWDSGDLGIVTEISAGKIWVRYGVNCVCGFPAYDLRFLARKGR